MAQSQCCLGGNRDCSVITQVHPCRHSTEKRKFGLMPIEESVDQDTRVTDINASSTIDVPCFTGSGVR